MLRFRNCHCFCTRSPTVNCSYLKVYFRVCLDVLHFLVFRKGAFWVALMDFVFEMVSSVKIILKTSVKLLRLFRYLKLLCCFLIKSYNMKNKCPKIDLWWTLSVKTLSRPVCEIRVKPVYCVIRKTDALHFL